MQPKLRKSADCFVIVHDGTTPIGKPPSQLQSISSSPTNFAIATLSDASLAQCRAAHYVEGLINARKSYDDARKAFGPKAGLTGGTAYALAACDINVGKLTEASILLDEIDIPAVTQLAGISDWGANVSLARAQILYKQGQFAAARTSLQQARLAFEKVDAEPYQQEASRHLDAALRQYP